MVLGNMGDQLICNRFENIDYKYFSDFKVRRRFIIPYSGIAYQTRFNRKTDIHE